MVDSCWVCGDGVFFEAFDGLCGFCRCGDVYVIDGAFEQAIAHTSSHKEGVKAFFFEGAKDCATCVIGEGCWECAWDGVGVCEGWMIGCGHEWLACGGGGDGIAV